MGWLLLHRPVGPALPLNSILQAIIRLHQPLLICCSPGPGSCQALHLPARPGTHSTACHVPCCQIAASLGVKQNPGQTPQRANAWPDFSPTAGCTDGQVSFDS